MIQRVQSIYLAVAIVCMAIVSLGVPVFEFIGLENTYVFSSKGIHTYDLLKQLVASKSIPMYIVSILMILGLLVMLISYKNYKRQLAIGKYLSFGFAAWIIILIIYYFSAFTVSETDVTKSFGIGFYLTAVAMMMVLLAIFAIRRDQSLIESLNRIR